jgi:hypothetical protein
MHQNWYRISYICKTNTIPILMHQMRFSTNQVSSVVLRPKKLEIRKKNRKTVKDPNTVPWIEPNQAKDRAMNEGYFNPWVEASAGALSPRRFLQPSS